MQSKAAGHAVRSDDNADVLRKRLQEYGATTRMIPFYEKRGLVTRVDANTAVDEVSTRIRAIIATYHRPSHDREAEEKNNFTRGRSESNRSTR